MEETSTRLGTLRALCGMAFVATGCAPLAAADDSGGLDSASPGSGVAAECPSPEDFQAVGTGTAIEVSWEALELDGDLPLGELLTIFVEGNPESIAAAVCERALGREDIVDTDVYPLSGRVEGSATATIDLSHRGGLVGYSLLSGDRANSLGFAYFVVDDTSDGTRVTLEPWDE